MDDDPQISILDARLAEIDRRLRTIQTGLADDQAGLAPRVEVPEPQSGEPPATASTVHGPVTSTVTLSAVPDAAPESEMLARLRELTSAQERVLAAMRVLLAGIAPGATTGPGPVSVSAGPFTDIDALRSFQRSLEALPEVRAVEVRGFEGGDRAVIDVQL